MKQDKIIENLIKQNEEDREFFKSNLEEIRKKPNPSQFTKDQLDDIRQTIDKHKINSEERHKLQEEADEVRHQKIMSKIDDLKLLPYKLILGTGITMTVIIIGGMTWITEIVNANKEEAIVSKVQTMIIDRFHPLESRVGKIEDLLTKYDIK